jgi:hypothetical protein
VRNRVVEEGTFAMLYVTATAAVTAPAVQSLGPPFHSVTCMSLDEIHCDKAGQVYDDPGQEPVCASKTGRAGRLIFRRVALTEHVGFRSGDLRREHREQVSEARYACKRHRACRDNGYSQL